MEFIRELERAAPAISDIYSLLLLCFEVPIDMRILWVGLDLFGTQLLSYLVTDTTMMFLVKIREVAI